MDGLLKVIDMLGNTIATLQQALEEQRAELERKDQQIAELIERANT